MSQSVPSSGDDDVRAVQRGPGPAQGLDAGRDDAPAPAEGSADAAVAQFLADLRELRTRAGAPSYADLARRTGLPRSTVYDGLRRKRLPNLRFTLALVRTLGGGESDWAQRWAGLRSRLDAPAESESVTPPPRPWYRQHLGWLVAVAVVIVAVTASTTTFVLSAHSARTCRAATLYRVTADGDLMDAAGDEVATIAAGELFVVRNRTSGPYAHRLLGTAEATGKKGYADEAKLSRLRDTCT